MPSSSPSGGGGTSGGVPPNVQVAFTRLDPIIRTLLASMQGDRAKPGTARANEEHTLATLRVRSNLIRRLRATAADIAKPTKDEFIKSEDNSSGGTVGSESLVTLAEFVLLPLILILQAGLETPPPSPSPASSRPSPQSSTSQQDMTSFYIRRTARLRCMEDAASTITAYVSADRGKSALLDAAIVIRCLVACTMSLSAIETAFTEEGNTDKKQQQQQQQQQNDSTGDEKKSSGSGMDGGTDRGALDAGDECRIALLKCIASLFGLAKVSVQSNDKAMPREIRLAAASGSPLSQKIAAHMDGSLIARIVGSCLTMLRMLVAEASGRDISRCNWAIGLTTLDTLREMMDSVPIADIWRKVLPGSFVGLFKLAVASSRVQAAGALSSSKLGANTILTITSLLRVSLSSRQDKTDGNTSRNADAEVVDEALPMESPAAAQLFAAASSAGATTASMSLSSSLDDASIPYKATLSPFFDEVNTRLPAPLIILLKLTSVHRSVSVKRAGIDLCMALFVDTREVWMVKKPTEQGDKAKEEESTNSVAELERAAVECCLSLLGDNDAKVASAALGAIRAYRKAHTDSSWKQMTSTRIIPRLLELIQGLPTLARSGRESELRSQVRLVGGYLKLSLNLDDETKDETKEKSKEQRRQHGEMASALACESVSSIIRKSLTDLLRIDYNTVSVSPQMPSKLLIEQGSSSSVFHLTRVNRFLYLRDESSVASTMEMLRLFGMALGTRRGALFVDSCIAELCDAAKGMSRSGKSQIDWLDQWAGLVVLSKEILAASFGGRQVVASSMDTCRDKMSLKILQSLVSSVLPIITRPPLWTLPTTLQIAEDEGRLESIDRNEGVIHSYLASTRGIEAALEHRPADTPLDSETSATTFCGNAIFIGFLMELIGTICDLLGESIRPFLAIIMYPVLEKTSVAHHHHVQQAALLTLEQISQADGCAAVTTFLSRHFDYLVDSVIAKLRRPGGASSATNHELFCSGVVEILLRSLAKEADGNGTHVSLLGALLDNILVAYDDSVSRVGEDVQRRAALGLLKLFEGAIAFLRVVMTSAYPQDRQKDNAENEAKAPWLDTLAAFQYHSKKPDDDDEAKISAREGFERHHASKENSYEMDPSCTPDNQGTEQPLDKARIASAIAAVNSILSRCCYLLSVHDLKVERASCEVMISAFHFLAPAERIQKATETESESAANASLVAISDCWPSILARLKMTSHEIRARDCKSTMLIMSDSHRETALLENEVFVAKLFELVSCMCEISGDFMISRFEQDVWPIFAQLIGHEVILRGQQKGRRNAKLLPNMSATRRAIAEADSPSSGSNRQQPSLLALLDCVSRCFGSKQLRYGLAGLVLPAGTVMLPLLADDGEVGDATAKAIQALLVVDSDALWRPLLVVSGGCVPPRLFKSTGISGDKGKGLSVVTKDDATEESTIMRRAKELVQYADDLPEQVIV